MPSYAIHLAVAEEYLRKHDEYVENYDEFIKGVIYPDTVVDKTKTHYGRASSESNLYLFLQDNKMDKSFSRGCFIHLLTDYVFYNKYIECWSPNIYGDYDILNDNLIKKYKLDIPEEVKDVMIPVKNKELSLLSMQMIDEFIEDVSKIDIDTVVQEIKQKDEKWTKFRPLKIIK